MSVLTINAFPSNSYVTVVYNSETTVGMVPFTMEIETGSTIQYKVEALQCTPDPDPSKGSEYKTLLVDEDKTLSVILNYIGAVQPDTWVPALGNETFPTHIAMLGKGGWRSVKSNDERDAIPSARREAGMSVYVTSDEKLYILNEDLTTWTEFQPGSLKGGWKEVETAEERDAIPDDLLEVGMMVYVTSEAKGYILTSLNTEVTPTLKTWEEYKPGQGDYIRKITTYPVSSVSPLVDGEIIQYQGPTVPPYWNGYFYKDVQEYSYISSKSNDMGPASVRIIDEGKLKTYIRANQSAISGGWSDLKLKFTGIYSATCVATNGEVEHNMNSYSTQEQWAELGLQISSSANYPISGSVAYIAPAHMWKQVNVQPETEIVDNVTTQSSTSALSANMGYELQQQISQLQGLGRYLSVWDCTTGLPQTDPTVIPYEYRAGDYYIVGNVVRAEPESLTGTQIVGEGLSLTIDPDTSRQNRFYTDLKRLIGEPLTDVDIYAVYTKNAVTSIKSSSASGDTSTVTLSRQGSAYVKQLEVKALLESMEISDYESFIGTSIRVHSEGSKGKILVYGIYRSTEGYDTQTPALGVYTRETKDGEDPVEGIKKIIEDEWYITITGDLVLGPVWSCTVYKLSIGDSGSPINWVYDINIGGTRTGWLDPFIIEGTPEEGDIVRVSYRTEKINYKPNGTEYTGEPSTTIEDREVSIDDSYIYDGLVWHLLSNAQKEITFASIVGSPYDNTELADALHSLEVETDNETIHSNLEDELEVIGIKSTDSSYSTMKVWKGLKADYNLLTKDANTIYIITDER